MSTLKFLEMFPDSQLERLLQQLDSSEDCFARSNMRGHMTTSAAVLNPTMDKMLMIHHIHHQRWLPPGGHYEGPGSLWDSAVREVAEETGVIGVWMHSWCEKHGIPVNICSHPIAAGPSKGKGAHWHHNFRYLPIADEIQITPQLDEVRGARWLPLTELLQDSSENMVKLVGRILEIVHNDLVTQS